MNSTKNLEGLEGLEGLKNDPFNPETRTTKGLARFLEGLKGYGKPYSARVRARGISTNTNLKHKKYPSTPSTSSKDSDSKGSGVEGYFYSTSSPSITPFKICRPDGDWAFPGGLLNKGNCKSETVALTAKTGEMGSNLYQGSDLKSDPYTSLAKSHFKCDLASKADQPNTGGTHMIDPVLEELADLLENLNNTLHELDLGGENVKFKNERWYIELQQSRPALELWAIKARFLVL